MKRRAKLPILPLAVLAILANAPVRAEDRTPAFDIVGLRLGMTVDEAKAALKAYDPAIAINEHRQYYTYSDGVTHGLRSQDFVFYIDGSRKIVEGNQWGDEGIALYFSPTPDDQRVTYITRSQSNTPNPPTGQQYRDALIKKYGTPTDDSSGLLKWVFPAGKVDCTTGAGTYHPSRGNFLKYIFNGGVPGKFQKSGVTDLSQCASYLEYGVGLGATAPASNVTAAMIDVEATVRGEIRAREWVAGLTEQARKAREAKGTAPKL
jgi:hypothetical protein